MPRARSTSLNPIIYPDWWGHEYDATAANDDRTYIKAPKRLRSEDPCKAHIINKNVRKHMEDSLDKRLRHVYDKNTSSFLLVNASSSKKHRHHEPKQHYTHHEPMPSHHHH